MNTIHVENCKTLFIGRRGENEVTEVVFDFSEWQTEFGNGVIDLFVKRNGDSAAYPVVLSVDGTVATWLVSATDTNVADYGKAEYVYTVDGKIAKSAVFTFYVAEDIGQASGEAPDPYEDWIETLTGLGTETQLNAQAAEQSANDAAESAASAATSADQSEDSAEDAEAWAVGERNGEPVTEDDPTYNNNAKFWAGKAMTDAPVTSVNGKAGDIVLDLDDIPNGVQYARTTPAQVQQIGDNAADIADIEELIPTEASANNKLVDKNYVDSGDQTNTDAIAAINAKIPPQASASNQLADKILVNTKLMAYRKATDQDAIDSAQDGKINALTNLLNSKQSKITANGILKGNGNGGVSAAVAGMDYLPTSALYAYRSANAQDAIDNAQNTNIDKNTAAINTMQPAATAADIGKALIVKTVADGKPTSYEYGEAGGGGASTLTAGDGIDITEDVISNTQGIEYIVGTQTAATSKWTGISTDETLKVGKIIAYYLPYAGSSTAVTLALTMADGTTTREISLQLKPNATVTTQFPAGSIIILVYDGTYWRVNASYDTDTNTYPTGYCVTNGSVAAKAAACSFGYRGDTNYFPCLFRFANTATDATLAITTYAPEAAPIYVNGARTSAANTFGAGVILFLYYNGAYYCYNDGRFPILVDGAVTSVQEYATGLLDDYRTAAAQDAIDAGKQSKITASGILKGDGSGGVSSAVAGTDYATPQQVNDKYTKPSSGIPSSDMTAAVQASLSKADTALETVKAYADQAADSAAAAEDAQEAAEAVLASIPSDYTELSGDVDDLKSAIEKNNSVNMLDNVAVSTSTTNGITFSVIDTQTINVAGTSTALANKDIYSSQTMPEWLEKGKQYYLEYSTPSGNVLFRVYIYRNGTLVSTALVEAVSNQVFTIPTDATGIIFRLAVKKSLTVNENVTFAVLNAKSNLQLSNNIENLYPVILTTNSADAHNETINLLNPNTITEGYVLSNNIPVANSSFYYSDYIEIGMNRFCYSQVGSVSGQVNCYDFNKNYIGTIDYGKNTDHFEEGNVGADTNLRFRTFTPLDGTVYIRVCGGINRPKMVTPFFSPMDYGATAQNLPYGKIFRKYGKRVAMFGDSITLGTNGNGGGAVVKNLSFYLESLTGWVVENYGVGSQGWVSTRYTDTIAYDKISTTDLSSYDIITLCYGVNDTGATLGDYDSTDETTVCGQINKCINYILTQNNKAIVILIAPFNTAGNGSFPDWRYPVVLSGWSRAQLAEKEKEIAAYYHIPFISQDDSPFNGYGISTPDGTRTNQFIGTDNVHPTPDGYKVEGHWLTAKIKSFVY